MWNRETNANEPPMTHRNQQRRHQNRSRPLAPGIAWKTPTYWPCGVRCKGGVNLFRAFVWNLRTWLAMVREKTQADKPQGRKYRCANAGADCSVVAMKRGNARGAKGAGHSRRDRPGQLATGGTEWLWRRAAALNEWHEPCELRDSSTVP